MGSDHRNWLSRLQSAATCMFDTGESVTLSCATARGASLMQSSHGRARPLSASKSKVFNVRTQSRFSQLGHDSRIPRPPATAHPSQPRASRIAEPQGDNRNADTGQAAHPDGVWNSSVTDTPCAGLLPIMRARRVSAPRPRNGNQKREGARRCAQKDRPGASVKNMRCHRRARHVGGRRRRQQVRSELLHSVHAAPS